MKLLRFLGDILMMLTSAVLFLNQGLGVPVIIILWGVISGNTVAHVLFALAFIVLHLLWWDDKKKYDEEEDDDEDDTYVKSSYSCPDRSQHEGRRPAVTADIIED